MVTIPTRAQIRQVAGDGQDHSAAVHEGREETGLAGAPGAALGSRPNLPAALPGSVLIVVSAATWLGIQHAGWASAGDLEDTVFLSGRGPRLRLVRGRATGPVPHAVTAERAG